MADSPYPELKKTHAMAHVGRPFTDSKSPAAAPVWDVIEGYGRFHVLISALELGVFDTVDRPDAVLHDTDRPEWRPLLNVIDQLVWSADGRGVHTVVVDGRVVVEDGHMTTRTGRQPSYDIID